MDKKKILIVSRAFYPIIAPRSFRATELAKEFARQGHDVTVLTHKRNHNYSDFEKTHNLKIEDFVKGKWKEIKGNSIVNKAFRFILSYFFLYPNIQLTPLIKKALKNQPACNLLISIAKPFEIHWGVALARNKNIKLCEVWVADCGDPFIGKERKTIPPFYYKLIDKWFCKHPDFITVPIKEAIPAYHPECRSKIRVIPQGFNFKISRDINDINNKFPKFVYAGLLSLEKRNPTNFLNFLCTIKNTNYKFIVFTKNKDILEPYQSILKDKLEVKDFVPREELLELLKKVDFAVNFENRNKAQSPSKLIDYAIVNKPILSVKTDSFNEIDEIHTIEFLNKDYKNQLVIENIEQYHIKNVTNSFLNLYNENS
jgi:hypothetical protein